MTIPNWLRIVFKPEEIIEEKHKIFEREFARCRESAAENEVIGLFYLENGDGFRTYYFPKTIEELCGNIIKFFSVDRCHKPAGRPLFIAIGDRTDYDSLFNE